MEERDIIFRDQLIGLMSDLNGGLGKDKDLRRLVGNYAKRLFSEAGARDWVDLKARADGSTYDSMLQLFREQSQAATKIGDTTAVRAFEILAISLIARRQYQADLLPGVAFLDKFIASCVGMVKRTGAVLITPNRPTH